MSTDLIDVRPCSTTDDAVDTSVRHAVLDTKFLDGRARAFDVLTTNGPDDFLGERPLLRPCAARPTLVQHVPIVFSRSSDPEVSGITAHSVVAGMANVLVLRNGAECQLVCDPMSAATRTPLDDFREPSVAFVHDVTRPRPTSVRSSTSVNLIPEPRICTHFNTLSQGVIR